MLLAAFLASTSAYAGSQYVGRNVSGSAVLLSDRLDADKEAARRSLGPEVADAAWRTRPNWKQLRQQGGQKAKPAQQRAPVGKGGVKPAASAATSNNPNSSNNKNPQQTVRKLDKNGDGKVSRSEWKGQAPFNTVDTNNDGFVVASEFGAFWAKAKGRGSVKAVAVTARDQAVFLTLSEAEKVTKAIEDQPVAAVPPSIDDITAILEEQELADPQLGEKRREAANTKPPAGASKGKLVEFYLERGVAAGEIGVSDQEIGDLERALRLAEETGAKSLPNVLAALATAESRRGRLKEAIAIRERLSGRLDVKGKAGFRGKVMSGLVIAYAKLGQMRLAKQRMQEVELLLGRTKDRMPAEDWKYELFPRAQMAKATLLEHQGKLDKAEALRRAAIGLLEIAIAKDAGNKFTAGAKEGARRDLANNLLRQGRLVEAEIEARMALLETLARVGKYATDTPYALLAFVAVLGEQGRLAEASQLAEAAVEIMQSMGLTDSADAMVAARIVLAQALLYSGATDEAIAIYDRVQGAIKGNIEVYKRRLLRNNDWLLALVQAGRHEEALPILRKGDGKSQNAFRRGILAMAQAGAGDRTAALAGLREAVPKLIASVEEQEDEEYTLGTSKEFRVSFVLEAYIGLLADMVEGGGPETGQLLAEAFRMADAARGRSVQKAVAASSARAKVQDAKLAELLRDEQDTGKRLTALSGTLANALSVPLDQQDQAGVKELRSQIETLRGAQEALLREIDRKFPEYARLLNPDAPDIDALRAALRPGEAFVSIHLGQDRTFVWAVPKAGNVAFAITSLTRDRAAKVVEALRGALSPQAETLGDIPDFDVRLAHTLYQQTLEPVGVAWRPAKSLLISSNGALGQLPLSILPTERVTRRDIAGPLFASYRDVPWLAKTHAVTFVPSAATLVALRLAPAASAARQPFIGFGDPLFNEGQAEEVTAEEAAVEEAKPVQIAARSGAVLKTRGLPLRLRSAPNMTEFEEANLSLLPRLPDTAEEVRSLAITMHADPAQSVLLGAEANESAVKSLDLSGYRVIAFATHGLTPGEVSGLREPALALSSPDVSDTDGDGLLTMTEIMGLKLDADWVVLSACNTGTGRGAGAEAVSGLGRAFFYAGTRALLVSGWPVETVSARLLTTDLFRRQTEESGLDRAEALRQAMMALMNRAGETDENGKTVFYYAHPIFWAPFALVGDGGGSARAN